MSLVELAPLSSPELVRLATKTGAQDEEVGNVLGASWRVSSYLSEATQRATMKRPLEVSSNLLPSIRAQFRAATFPLASTFNLEEPSSRCRRNLDNEKSEQNK